MEIDRSGGSNGGADGRSAEPAGESRPYRRIAALAALAVAVAVAPTVLATPKPPRSFCMKDAACETAADSGQDAPAPAPSGKRLKWHPGHYMNVPRASSHTQPVRFGYYDEIGTNKNIVGVSVFYRWSQLERSKGDYSSGIALIRAELDKLKSLPVPKRLVINMNDRAYGDSNCSRATDYYPSYILSAASKHLYSTPSPACPWKKWNAETMTHYIELMTALGKEFDGDPYVEMISPFQETALNWSGGPVHPEFDEDAYYQQLRRLAAAMKEAWPTTIVRVPTNWGFSDKLMSQYVAYLASIGVGAGNPDVCPSCKMPIDRIIAGEIGGTDYRGVIPNVMSVEASVLGYDAVGPRGGFTVKQLYDYANSQQRATHIFWDRNLYTGNASSDPSVGQQWPAMLRLFAERPVTQTSCPKAIKQGCATN